MHARTHALTHARTNTRARVHTHTHTHTHTQHVTQQVDIAAALQNATALRRLASPPPPAPYGPQPPAGGCARTPASPPSPPRAAVLACPRPSPAGSAGRTGPGRQPATAHFRPLPARWDSGLGSRALRSKPARLRNPRACIPGARPPLEPRRLPRDGFPRRISARRLCRRERGGVLSHRASAAASVGWAGGTTASERLVWVHMGGAAGRAGTAEAARGEATQRPCCGAGAGSAGPSCR